SAGGSEYRATRSLRRRPSGISPAAKLERRADDGRWLTVPETDKIGEYEKALARAVGLDYDGYVRAVMLPQGAFDEFLRGNDAERREVIKALLRAFTIDRMRELAVKERQEAKGQLDQARARIDNEYEGVTREREAELAERVRELEGRLQTVRAEQKEAQARLEGLAELERLDRERREAADELARLDATEAEVGRAREALERAAAAEALVPVIRAFRSRERDLSVATAAVAERRGAVVDAERLVADAQERHDRAVDDRAARQEELKRRVTELESGKRDAGLLKRFGGRLDLATSADDEPFDEDRLARLHDLRSGLGELRQLERAAAAAEGEQRTKAADAERRREALARQRVELAALVEEGKRKRQELDAAKDELERAQVEHQAAALRAHLHVGEPCPVCQGVVAALPEAAAPVALEALRARVDAAQAAVDGLRERYAKESQRLASEEAAVAELE